MLRTTRLRIDRTALIHNLNLLKSWNGIGQFICPMVKANAYGHGAVPVSHVIEEQGASALGVALIEEGIQLRTQGIRMPILSFTPLDLAAAKVALEQEITPVVGRMEDLEALKKANVQGAAINVHLEFNSGMNRLGFDPSEYPALFRFLEQNRSIKVLGICTHLTHGEDIQNPLGQTSRQFGELKKLSENFPGVCHGHKSATLATLARAGKVKVDGIGARPGIALYGPEYDPGLNGPGLRPVMSWVTTLIRVHTVEKGEAVSYGGRWVAPRRSYIGVVPLGYGDGYGRSLSNKGQMLFRGRRVPVVGSVCMDYTLLDLSAICADGLAQPGEEIIVLGRQGNDEITAAMIAEQAGTITYEIVTGIRERVAREVYDSDLEKKSQPHQ